jgi:transcriptional regulator with XRE-family HTH domain
MGTSKWAEDYFRKQLKAERERRNWSQAELAKMLSDREIPMHWTTVAKIEKGNRSVRIDEAAGIADLFEVSLDALMGRTIGSERDLLYTVQHALQTSHQAPAQIALLEGELRERVAEMEAFEFDECTAVATDYRRAAKALARARDALVSTLAPLRDAVVAATASQVIRNQIAEIGEAR